MKKPKTRWERVVAMVPNTRGVAFAVLEGPTSLVDWGLKGAHKERDRMALRIAKQLLMTYQPHVLVLEDPTGKGSHKRPRVRKLIPRIQRLASSEHIETRQFGRHAIRVCFADADATTKKEIAAVIAARLPELEPHMPPARKPWMTEHRRMGVFDATALAITYYWSLLPLRAKRT